MIFFYIDPGTGSMLFSIVIGLAATLYFSLRAVAIRLKMAFSSKGVTKMAKDHCPYVIYCEGKQYLTLFGPIVQEFERRHLPLVYYTSFAEDPILSRACETVHAQYIGEGNKAYAKLNFLNADIVLMTTPGLDVYQLKRSRTVGKYVHILHATSDATGYRVFGLDFYDVVLLTGEYQQKDIRYLEKERGLREKELAVVGCPYLDELMKKKSMRNVEIHPFTVLVSPSWGKSALLSRYGERLLDPLIQTGMQVIVRPHPQSRVSENELLGRLQKRYQGKDNVTWDYESDNSHALSQADVMVSDFSGIIFDFTFLYDKPVLYAAQDFDKRPYDAFDVPDEMWQFASLAQFGIPLKEEDFPRIGEVVRNASESKGLEEARARVKAEAWAHQGNGAEKVVDCLERLEREGGRE